MATCIRAWSARSAADSAGSISNLASSNAITSAACASVTASIWRYRSPGATARICGPRSRTSALSSTRMSPMSFIAYPNSATFSDRHAVTAAAARAQRPTSARNDSPCQSSVITENRRPARTIALAVSCAPCTPWLYVMSAMSHAGVTAGSGWMLARQMGSLDSASSRATRIAGP